MNTPSLLRGALYPTTKRGGCPRFHACQVTKKCQNYDPHQHECTFCESRVTKKLNQAGPYLGGCLPEGEYIPDMQDAIRIVERAYSRSFSHPDNPITQMENPSDIRYKIEKEERARDIMATFQATGIMTMEEQATEAYYDPVKRQLIGRIE